VWGPAAGAARLRGVGPRGPHSLAGWSQHTHESGGGGGGAGGAGYTYAANVWDLSVRSRTIFCRRVPSPSVTIRNFCIAARDG
jgi:hypothetical protein